MRFEQLESDVAVATAAADLLEETVRKRPDARVILPAGKTPVLLYREILKRRERLDLSAVRFFQLDEYVGSGPKDLKSFHSQLRTELLVPLRRAARKDSLLDGLAKDPDAEIERHAARLAQLGGADLAFLGLGQNGHVGFNEPGTTIDQRARMVALARTTRQAAVAEFGRGKAPTQGITLGLHELHAARRIALLVTGAGKASILAALFDEPPAATRPASLLLGHPELTVLADFAAAAHLHTPVAVVGTPARRPRALQPRGATFRS